MAWAFAAVVLVAVIYGVRRMCLVMRLIRFLENRDKRWD